MDFVAVGLSYKTAPLEIRELAHVPDEAVEGCVQRLIDRELIEAGVLFSTCNRTELFAIPGASAGGRLVDAFGQWPHQLDYQTWKRFAYELAGEPAIAHLFEVAAGLDSMVLGEGQVLGQLQRAVRRAQGYGLLNRQLDVILRGAVRAGKRVRRETDVGRSAVSVSHVAVAQAAAVLGDLEGRSVLLVGTGSMSEVALRLLRNRRISEVFVASESLERAERTAHPSGARGILLADIASVPPEIDVIIASSSAPSYVLDAELIHAIQSRRRFRPLVIVDLAVPRNADPAVATIEGVKLFNIDHLRNLAESNRESRRAALPAVQRLIQDEQARTLQELSASAASKYTSPHRSEVLALEAVGVIPGGVNSPVRAYRAVGGTPRFIARADGPWLWDVDGNRYLDLVCSWGPLVLGHRPAAVRDALREQLTKGWTYGAPTEAEIDLAKEISRRMPSIEMLRLVNSGTEAVMSALRLARAATGRPKIIKFAGGYHGHADAMLVNAGSGVATLGIPGTSGVTPGAAADTIVVSYNSLDEVEAAFANWPQQVAAVIVEPVAGNMGVVPPAPGFLDGLRRVTVDAGALLIFDEVITGFRLAPGGAQSIFGVTPDLTCLGKVIGGGLPIGAYGGRRDLMQMVAPAGPVYQAGTLSGNPLAVAAGLATIRLLDDAAYRRLEVLGSRAVAIIRDAAMRAGRPVTINHQASMFTTFFTEQPVNDYSSAQRADTKQFSTWFHAMLKRGVALPPSQLEACFVSTAHGDAALERLEAAVEPSFRELSPH